MTGDITRRRLLGTGCCAACVALAGNRESFSAEEINGPGYKLQFVGSQRETIMMGRREGQLDLRSLSQVPHLYGIGPIEGLTGEVTIVDGRPSLSRVGAARRLEVAENFDAAVPFFVWAELTGRWQERRLPNDVRTSSDLERFIGDAAEQASLTKAFPFLVTGAPAKVSYHVVNAPRDGHLAGPAAHDSVQVGFEMTNEQVTLLGFYSREHRGVFTHMNARTHVHVVNQANTQSGHVDALELSGELLLHLPQA